MGGEAHANLGCYCGFILLVCTETALAESPWSWAELSELHGSLTPPPQESLEPKDSDVMSSQNVVC